MQIVAWHNLTAADHQEKLDTFGPQGYRGLSFSLYGNPSNPMHACVLVKRPVVIAEHMMTGLNAAQFQQTFNDMASKGFGPHIVTATGSGNSVVFGASFIPASPIPLTKSGLTPTEFNDANQQATVNNQKLVWFDCYGTPGDERYIATWWPDPEMLAWNCDGIGEDGTVAQQRFDGISNTWAYMAQSVMTPAGNITSLYYDGNIDPYETHLGLTSADYQDMFDDRMAKGLVPIRVCGQGEGAGARFNVIFATMEKAPVRVFTPHGATVPNASVDAIFQDFMKANNIRSASVAVVADKRLVYTAGYTWAEPGFPAVLPKTFFRQASCSKIYTAYALYVLMQQKRDALPKAQQVPIKQMLTDTTLQSVLNLTTLDNTPVADDFAKVTLLDLLNSISGIDQRLIYRSREAAKLANKPLPASREMLCRYIAGQKLLHLPGDLNNNVYGNTDYFLLSEVVRVLANANTYEDAVQKLVGDPLHLHVRGSRSLLAEQLPYEARYALTQPKPSNEKYGELPAGPSIRTADMPMVPSQYGVFDCEMFSGCGGLSISAVDMARMVASLSALDANPAITTDTLDQWMANGTEATKIITSPNGSKHGFQGWDWVFTNSAANHQYMCGKGGSLPGTATSVQVTTGGYSFIAFFADQGRPGVKADWYAPLVQLSPPQEWATTDLFPHYNMPSFDTSKSPTPIVFRPIMQTPSPMVHMDPPLPDPIVLKNLQL